MCMDKVFSTEFYENMKGKGYRVFRVKNNQLYSPFTDVHTPRLRRRWLLARPQQVPSVDGQGTEYTSGWHIFLNKDDAASYFSILSLLDTYVVAEVEWQGILARGEEDGVPCIATMMMKIGKVSPLSKELKRIERRKKAKAKALAKK